MKKKIVLLVHGFMIHDSHDFNSFYDYITKNDIFNNCEFRLIKLYDRLKAKTSKPKTMEKYLKNEVISLLNNNYDVTLIGYSFSCNLVAKVAKDLKLKGVIYFAPSLKLIKTNLFLMHVKNAIKVLKLKLKHGKVKAQKILDRTKTSGVVKLSLHIFLTMIKYRKYFKNEIPFLIMRGKEDTYCLQSDVTWILKNSKADYIKSVTINKDGWNHFFVRRENLIPFEPTKEVLAFLKKIQFL